MAVRSKFGLARSLLVSLTLATAAFIGVPTGVAQTVTTASPRPAAAQAAPELEPPLPASDPGLSFAEFTTRFRSHAANPVVVDPDDHQLGQDQ